MPNKIQALRPLAKTPLGAGAGAVPSLSLLRPSADTALGPEQGLRLRRALRTWLDRVPWPGAVSFQRVSWAGWRCRFHSPERWDALKVPRG